MPRLTEAQLEERARGLGASDVATAAGVNPYQSPYELYLTKIGELDPDATIDEKARDRMERGHRLEDVALAWDRDLTGEAYERVNRTIWHPRLPFVYCHPDARRRPWKESRRLIEVKTSLRRWSEVPRPVEAQVQMQMACTGAAAVDVLVLGFDGPPQRHVVERDDILIDALEGVAVAFWDRVERRDPPPIDGSAGARRYLDRTAWRDEPDLTANPLQRRLLEDLIATRDRIDVLEVAEETLANQIRLSMAGSGRLFAPGLGRVVWTAPTTTRTVRWKDVAAAYRRALEEVVRFIKIDWMTGYVAATEETSGDDVAREVLPFLPGVPAEYGPGPDGLEALHTSERESRTFRVYPEREES